MRFDTLITGGSVVSSTETAAADVGISGGKIVAVGALRGSSAAEVIDASNLLLFPGLIDTQVHFREPGMEHKEDLESGTRSAIAGGVTAIFEMPNTNPATTSSEALNDKLRRANGRAWCDYGFFVGAANDNLSQLQELELLPGSPGVKIFMGSSTGSLLLDSEEALETALRSGSRRVSVHAEDEPRLRQLKAELGATATVLDHPKLRDERCAFLATERLLRASRTTGRPVHVLHVSTQDELPLIQNAKDAGIPVTAEVTPQHLYFEAPGCYEKLGALAQMNPPLRSAEHREALWRAVGRGLFDVFGSDHAPHTLEEKAKPYPSSPSGMPGVQTILPVLLTFMSQGKLRIEDVVRMGCENPTHLFGIRDKGFIKVGFDADIVLVDPTLTKTVERKMVQSKCGWSPYEGEALTGWPVRVLLRGSTVMRDGELIGEPSGNPCRYNWKS